jgi:hypothetical protein
MIPGRPYPTPQDRQDAILRRAAAHIIGEIKVPTYGSLSERIRANKASDAAAAVEIEKRLDAIDEIKARALPIIHRELQEQELSVQAMENDALAMAKVAEEITSNRGPTVASAPSPPVSGAAQGNGSAEAADA